MGGANAITMISALGRADQPANYSPAPEQRGTKPNVELLADTGKAALQLIQHAVKVPPAETGTAVDVTT